jgi:UDP-N-acetylmuramate--alanine ligase
VTELAHIKHVYFVGIGGIGMSGLARWFLANGRSVAGYDRTPTDLTRALQAEGMAVHYEDETALIPAEVLAHPEASLVVYTPAIPAGHRELAHLRAAGLTVQKRSEVLGTISRAMRCVAVAGTHGKTTTSALVAHLLRQAGLDCAAFLGGLAQNYGTNLLLNRRLDPSTVAVVEADEYDRSFLTLRPYLAAITSTDADHLDIYGNAEALHTSFAQFAWLVAPNGKLFLQKDIHLAAALPPGLAVAKYGLAGSPTGGQAGTTSEAVTADFEARNIRIEPPQFVFDLHWPGGEPLLGLRLRVPGYHNVENATVAAALALELGLSPAQVREGLATFRGVKRRFEYWVERPGRVLIDDYAHHPTELRAFLTSVRALYPGRHLTVLFQPHLFTRTRDFAEGFAQSLSLADTVVLLPIYPAREQPLPGVDSAMLLAQVTAPEKFLVEYAEAVAFLARRPLDVVATVGAGDVDRLVAPLAKVMDD